MGAFLRALDLKYHGAVDFGKQGIVSTPGNIHSGMNTGAALPYQNIAGSDHLATIALHAEPLAVRVASVAAAAAALLVCHDPCPLSLSIRYVAPPDGRRC